jgi:hypothetical protein
MNRRQLLSLVPAAALSRAASPAPLRIATFQADVTPPLGTPLCCAGRIKPALTIVTPLTVRGIVLFGTGKPVVLAVFDWVGIGNESHTAWRRLLARAANTDADRVTVHVIHVHDAPQDDIGAERLLGPLGLAGRLGNREFFRSAMERTAAALRQAVREVASNRRLLGPDGKVMYGRMSSCKVPAMRALPEGVIDPMLRQISFWNGERPLAVVSTYACHPQSHYGQGGVSWDFVGVARALREAALPGVAHIHFDGAGGNIAAGKYNDGSPEMRPILAARLAAGMKAAWETAETAPVTAADLGWKVVPVKLPVAEALRDPAPLQAKMKDPAAPAPDRLLAALNLAWATREGPIPLFRLDLGRARMLFLPGELFVEYQLKARGPFVAVAAYGDYGPGYIGTQVSYTQGGYETGPASRTSPEVEEVLTAAIHKLME